MQFYHLSLSPHYVEKHNFKYVTSGAIYLPLALLYSPCR